MPTPSVLFICLGNICRSPTAEAVFRKRAHAAGLDVHIDSAGTGRWHEGEPPDPRAIAAGRKRGYSFEGQTGRQVERNDFFTFDYILAMDRDNLAKLTPQCPPETADKLHLFLHFAPGVQTDEVPDPYYGGARGFETVLDLIEAASDGLIKTLKAV